MSERDRIHCCYCGEFVCTGDKRLDRCEHCGNSECRRYANEAAQEESLRDATAYAEADGYRAYR